MKKRAAGGFYMEYTVSALSKDAESIRTEVFIEEQGFSNEFDETDCIAEHIVFYENGTPAAVCRFYPDHERAYRQFPFIRKTVITVSGSPILTNFVRIFR